MNLRLLSLTFTILVIASCGRGNSSSELRSGTEVTASSIIVGGLEWSDVTGLGDQSGESVNARAVAHIDLPSFGSRCTGFMINDDILMTNHHCIPTAGDAKGVTASFEVVEGIESGSEQRFDCSTFIGNNQELDFALLKCEGSPGSTHGSVKLTTNFFSTNTSIYVIQQNCDYYSDSDCYFTKKISRGKASLVGQRVTHDADTLGGSSGSPVFNGSSHEVVGIHHAGLGNNGNGRGVENYAVSMTRIVPYILANFPAVSLRGHQADQSQADQSRNNNTMEGATQMGRFKRVRGMIDSSSDVDYFEFTVGQTDFVAIDLSIESFRADLDIYLIKKEAGVIGRSESVSSIEEISGTLSAGTYYLLVKGYRGATGNYTLTIR